MKISHQFNGKHCVITGGAQGIGLEIAKSFLDSGAFVSIWDYSDDALKHAREELSRFADCVSFSKVDVTSATSCSDAAARLTRSVDVLVNNAGITRDKSFKKMSEEEFDAVINTNLKGVFQVTKTLLERFTATPNAPKRIVNISSVVALYGNFGQTNYVAAKAGVIGMTKTWARELAKSGFTVNAIAPGFIATAMTNAMPPEVLQGMVAKVPVGRMGRPEDIANAVLFLASEGASYINGTTLSVDGGLVV